MKSYQVGPGHPPLETRFKPGNKEWQKREAKRKAKRSRRFGDDVKAVLASKVQVSKNGKSSSEIRLKGIIQKYVAEALGGSVSAANDLLGLRKMAADFGDMRNMVVIFGPDDTNESEA
jgi:hypothetical protein